MAPYAQCSFSKQSVKELFANKFAFRKDEEILVNAIDLCDVLFEKDQLSRKNKLLQERIELLETIQQQAIPQYRRFDIKA